MAPQLFRRDAVLDGLSYSPSVDCLLGIYATDDVLISYDHAHDIYWIEPNVCVNPHQMSGLGFEELMR